MNEFNGALIFSCTVFILCSTRKSLLVVMCVIISTLLSSGDTHANWLNVLKELKKNEKTRNYLADASVLLRTHTAHSFPPFVVIIMMRTSNTKCIIIIIICHVSLCIHNLLVVMSKAANNDEWWVVRKCYCKRQIDNKYTDSILTDAYIYEYTRNPLSRSSAQLHFQFYATFVGTSIATHAASFFFPACFFFYAAHIHMKLKNVARRSR